MDLIFCISDWQFEGMYLDYTIIFSRVVRGKFDNVWNFPGILSKACVFLKFMKYFSLSLELTSGDSYLSLHQSDFQYWLKRSMRCVDYGTVRDVTGPKRSWPSQRIATVRLISCMHTSPVEWNLGKGSALQFWTNNLPWNNAVGNTAATAVVGFKNGTTKTLCTLHTWPLRHIEKIGLVLLLDKLVDLETPILSIARAHQPEKLHAMVHRACLAVKWHDLCIILQSDELQLMTGREHDALWCVLNMLGVLVKLVAWKRSIFVQLWGFYLIAVEFQAGYGTSVFWSSDWTNTPWCRFSHVWNWLTTTPNWKSLYGSVKQYNLPWNESADTK